MFGPDAQMHLSRWQIGQMPANCIRNREHRTTDSISVAVIDTLDCAGENIRPRTSDELSNVRTFRSLIHLFRRTKLFDLPRPHDGDPVRNRHGLFLIVRHENRGDPESLM